MTLTLLASVSGAPGTTTTALGLALQWPRPVLLADVDPSASQSISAGFLGAGSTAAGMSGMLRAGLASGTGGLLDLCEPLDAEDHALFLPGFVHPGAAALFSGWRDLGEHFALLADRDVLADLGRVGPQGPPRELIRAADELLLVTRSSLRSLVALGHHLPPLLELVESASAACAVSLAVVGPGRPYSSAEISAQFGLPVALEVEWAPAHAEVLSDAAPPPKRHESSAFARSLARGARHLAARHERRVRMREGRTA